MGTLPDLSNSGISPSVQLIIFILIIGFGMIIPFLTIYKKIYETKSSVEKERTEGELFKILKEQLQRYEEDILHLKEENKKLHKKCHDLEHKIKILEQQKEASKKYLTMVHKKDDELTKKEAEIKKLLKMLSMKQSRIDILEEEILRLNNRIAKEISNVQDGQV